MYHRKNDKVEKTKNINAILAGLVFLALPDIINNH